MTTTNKIKLTGYEATKPSVSYGGTSANFTVYINDSYMEVGVDLGWCGKYDELEIETINAEYYDEEDNELDTSNIDLESLVIEVFEKYNTFGKIESEMEKAYHNDHK